MSATASETGRRVTVEEYRAMPEGGPRYQLVRGALIEMSPASTSRHQDVVLNIAAELRAFLRAHPIGQVKVSPFDVFLTPDDAYQPDVVFVAKDGKARVERDGVHGPPDLVVEVLSPSTRRLDLRDKSAVYASSGVREGWFVDLEIDEVRIVRWEAGAEAEVRHLGRAGVLETALLPGFSLAVAEALGPEQ